MQATNSALTPNIVPSASAAIARRSITKPSSLQRHKQTQDKYTYQPPITHNILEYYPANSLVNRDALQHILLAQAREQHQQTGLQQTRRHTPGHARDNDKDTDRNTDTDTQTHSDQFISQSTTEATTGGGGGGGGTPDSDWYSTCECGDYTTHILTTRRSPQSRGEGEGEGDLLFVAVCLKEFPINGAHFCLKEVKAMVSGVQARSSQSLRCC